jgi:hypothetical protein
LASAESKKKRGPAIQIEITNIRGAIARGPKDPAPYKEKRTRMLNPREVRFFRVGNMGMGPDLEYEYEVTVTPPPLTERQKKQWVEKQEERIRSLESESVALPDLVAEAEKALFKAQANYVRLLIEMDTFDESWREVNLTVSRVTSSPPC